MSDTAWLVLALVAGIVIAVAWITRELSIHRRRRMRRARRESGPRDA